MIQKIGCTRTNFAVHFFHDLRLKFVNFFALEAKFFGVLRVSIYPIRTVSKEATSLASTPYVESSIRGKDRIRKFHCLTYQILLRLSHKSFPFDQTWTRYLNDDPRTTLAIFTLPLTVSVLSFLLKAFGLNDNLWGWIAPFYVRGRVNKNYSIY